MRSFQKQFSLYGFRRILQNGEDYGSYYHKRFRRGKPFLYSAIVTRKTRIKMKTSESIHDGDVVEEPFFYALPYLSLLPPGHRYDSSIEIFGDDDTMIIEAFFREVQEDHKRSC